MVPATNTTMGHFGHRSQGRLIMQPWTYILLPDLPAPPTSLLDQIDLNLQPKQNNTGYLQTEPLTDWNGYTGPAALNVRVLFNDQYTQWLQQNITAEFENASLNYVTGPPQIKTTAPHRDFTRDYVLLFNIEPGGPDAELQFWQQTGHLVEREPGAACGSRSQLNLIDFVKGPTQCWCLTNATVLHSTDYLIKPRINLQVSFRKGNAFAENIIARHK